MKAVLRTDAIGLSALAIWTVVWLCFLSVCGYWLDQHPFDGWLRVAVAAAVVTFVAQVRTTFKAWRNRGGSA